MSEQDGTGTRKANGDAVDVVSAVENTVAPDLDYNTARLAYSIIESLLEHTTATNDLIALMAQAIDEDTQRALTNTPLWSNYLDSRRRMHKTRKEIEEFTELMSALSNEE